MGVASRLVEIGGHLLHVERVGGHYHLIIEQHARVATQFKHAETTSAATTVIVEPNKGQALVITDVVMDQKKVASGTLTIQFTDGVDTVILYKGSTVNVPISIHIAYQGRTKGWRNARVEMISAGTNPVTNVTVHYYHLKGKGVLTFANWDAER